MELVYLYIPCFLYYVERLQNAEVVFMYVKYMTHFQFCGIMHIGTHSSMYNVHNNRHWHSPRFKSNRSIRQHEKCTIFHVGIGRYQFLGRENLGGINI